LATLIVLLLLGLALLIVAANAIVWFWPAPIWEFELADGRVVLGEVVRREDPRQAGGGSLLVKTGNRELGGQDHTILDRAEIVSSRRPGDAVVVERSEGGDAIGRLVGDFELEAGTLELEVGSARLQVPSAAVESVVWRNRLGPVARAAHAARNVLRFVSAWPREANTEGGIYPALFGTVLMVLLMSVAVMPLGVLAAIYLYEYAADGLLLRIADQAVNNLAGVPSIVFGMFGLAFFIYGMGGAVDRAFFAGDLPSPTFGTGGILWASLTLAVLTIPVVVVATREGLQAVPSGWRDGARALGATRLQTLRRIVLPAALPGILTGLILAVSRAAGEVAPLMLTGVVKLAHGLPVDGEVPFFHLQRKFMHLSFHIYDVSMQSPNIEAAKPMAFASTLVLLLLVVAVNLTAIVVRRRVRGAYRVLEG
jgi:phosphate transport system permease protein